MKRGDTHDVHVEKNEIERFISDLQMIGPDVKVKGKQVYSDRVQLMSLSRPSSWVSSSFCDHGGWSSCAVSKHTPNQHWSRASSLCPEPCLPPGPGPIQPSWWPWHPAEWLLTSCSSPSWPCGSHFTVPF